jgi:hypothetical protein
LDNFTTPKVFTIAANTSSSSLEKDKRNNDKNGDDISLYKPINYLNDATASPSTPKTSATMVKHKITNNFKLPPFPVYVPSTTFSSSTLNLQSSTDPGSNDEASKNKKDTLESTSVTINSTSISHLSSVSSSASPSGLNTSNSACSVNTLSLGRVNPYLYQSESSLSNNSNNVTMTTSITSSNTNNEKTASYTSPFLDQKSNYNNVCSSATFPKSSSSSNDSYVSKLSHSMAGSENSAYSYKYSTDYYSNITTTNNSSSNGSSASDNIYRVQYSATNPFLDPLDSAPPSVSQSETNGLSSIFSKATTTARSGASSMVSEIAKKFEKLDFDEDLK